MLQKITFHNWKGGACQLWSRGRAVLFKAVGNKGRGLALTFIDLLLEMNGTVTFARTLKR